MKFLVVLTTSILLMELTESKPFISLKVVEIPLIIPKVDVLGAVGKVLGLKASLIGHVLKAKANILHKVANVKGGLGELLLSSSVPKGPVVHLTAVKPIENSVSSEPIASPPSPSSTYGAPSSTYDAPSSTYGTPGPYPG